MKNAIKFLAVILTLIFITGCGCQKKEETKSFYKITYEFNNGEEVKIIEVEEDDYAFEPIAPSRDGYNFLYWEYDGEKFDFHTPIKEDITLEAKWEKEIVIKKEPVVTVKPVVTTKPVTETKIELQDISLNSEVVNLLEGESYTLEVSYLPSNATDKKVYYSTSNSNVVEVNNGVIKAVGTGSANVIVSTSNGIKKVCKVTVISNENYIVNDRTLIIQRTGTYDDTTFENLLYDEIIINTISLTNNEDDRKVVLNGIIAPVIESNVDDITLEIASTALETKLIVNGKNNTITSLEEIKDVEVNNNELKLELPNLASITVSPEATFEDFTYNISGKIEMMSNSFFTTYYNKFLDGDVIVESNIDISTISGNVSLLDDTIYYVAVGTYDGDESLVTEVNIGDTTYDNTPQMLNIGNNAYIYAPIWKIDNGIFYIAYPWLNVHNENNITNIKMDTINYKVRLFENGDIKVESASGLNTIDGYKNEAVVEENKITYTTEHKDHDLGITLSDDTNIFNSVEYLIIKNNDNISLGQVETIGENAYTYIVSVQGEGEVTSEENYSNEYTIVVVDNGVTNITVDLNLDAKISEQTIDNLDEEPSIELSNSLEDVSNDEMLENLNEEDIVGQI